MYFIMNFFKKLFSREKKKEEVINDVFSQEQSEADYEQQSQGLEHVLGKMHNMVGHAIIPFQIGGAVDMYYFPNHISGTGFATMELLDPNGNGPKPNKFGTFELVAFTKQVYDTNSNEHALFNLIERRICGVFTTIGNYSTEAVLNPNETCEIPGDDGKESEYLIFDLYQTGGKEFKIGDRKHHLLLCICLFKSEMEYARTNGGAELLGKLKEAGYYPYSDLDREPIV